MSIGSITIYGKTSCTFCDRAKMLCETMDVEYEYINIQEQNISKSDLEIMVGHTVSSVPQITYEDGEYIGGFVELSTLIRENK